MNNAIITEDAKGEKKENNGLLAGNSATKTKKQLSLKEVEQVLSTFEQRRLEFNVRQQPGNRDTLDWDRCSALRQLSEDLVTMATVVFENMALGDQLSLPSSGSVGTLSTLSSLMGLASLWGSAFRTNDVAGGYELCCNTHGLKVWKKDFGNDRLIVRGEFVLPVSAQQYSSYASDISKRTEWDSNVVEARILERIADNVDICYVALKGIATFYPRDYINIRVIRRVLRFTEQQQRVGQETDSDDRTAYCSCSCSVYHPDVDAMPGIVRADVKVACYLAEPLKLPTSTSWCRVYMFSEVDPGGWVPSTLAKHLAARVLPDAVERIASCILDHYNIPWRTEEVYDAELGQRRRAASGLEYCSLCYNTLVPQEASQKECPST